MPKLISKKGINTRVISSNAISVINYKNQLLKVREWNESLNHDQKINMEPNFLKVRKCLHKAIETFGLNSKKNFHKLLLAVLGWSDDLEYKADIGNKHSNRQIAKINLDNMRITVKVMSEFLHNYSKDQKTVASFCDDLLFDLESALKDAEQSFTKIDKYFGSGKPLSSRDRAIHEMFSILSQKLNPKDKNDPVFAEIAQILETVYYSKKVKNKEDHLKDSAAPMRTALSRHKNKSNKNQLKNSKNRIRDR